MPFGRLRGAVRVAGDDRVERVRRVRLEERGVEHPA